MDVLRLRLGDPAWTAQLAPYWASLPAQGSLFSKEAWSADHLDILQDAGLARSLSAQVYHNFARHLLWCVACWAMQPLCGNYASAKPILLGLLAWRISHKASARLFTTT